MSSLYATTTHDVHALLAAGVPVDVIAHRMGRSVDAVELMLTSARQAGQERLTT